MNEHAGSACALSGLIVGLFAFLLHENVPTPPRPQPSSHSVEKARPGVELTKVAEVVAARPPVPTPRPASARGPIPPLVEALPSPKIETPPPASPPRRVPGPRGSVTTVELGESLAEVADRVYGSRASIETLWRANRDQLVRVDSPLAKGTLLRTP